MLRGRVGRGRGGELPCQGQEHPRYIIEDECNGCGDCTRICPVEVYNRFDAGIGVRKAIYKPHAQAVPDIVVKDQEHCIECGLCYDVCGKEAILREDEERVIDIQAASIIVATGYGTFDARGKAQLRYLTIPDVITSLEFERMINASGPTGGELRRLSNGKPPRSIAFVQCVGSRDIAAGRPYCSGVCCMYAMKNAMLIREKNPEDRGHRLLQRHPGIRQGLRGVLRAGEEPRDPVRPRVPGGGARGERPPGDGR